jgi:hypothetical protein
MVKNSENGSFYIVLILKRNECLHDDSDHSEGIDKNSSPADGAGSRSECEGTRWFISTCDKTVRHSKML